MRWAAHRKGRQERRKSDPVLVGSYQFHIADSCRYVAAEWPGSTWCLRIRRRNPLQSRNPAARPFSDGLLGLNELVSDRFDGLEGNHVKREVESPTPSALHAADAAAIEGLGTMVRRSDTMMARRRRVLSETRKLLQKEGISGISIRQVAKNADVSPRTIYNIFESKDQLILVSIRSYYDIFLATLQNDHEVTSVEWIIETAAVLHFRSQQIKEYLSATVLVYFSMNTNAIFKKEIYNIGAGFLREWLIYRQSIDQIRKNINIERCIRDISNMFYSQNHEWISGILSDEEFTPFALKAMLIYLAGISLGDTKREVEMYLSLILDMSPEIIGILERAQKRVSEY